MHRTPKSGRRVGVVATVVALVAATAATATTLPAQQPPMAEPEGGFSYPEVIEVDDRGLDSGGLSAELATVPVASSEVDGLIAAIEHAALLSFLSALEARDADRRIAEMEAESERVTAERELRRADRLDAREALALVRAALTELAVVAYVEGGVSLAFDDEWSVVDDNEEASTREALVQVGHNQIAARDELQLRIESLTIQIDDRTARLEELANRILEQTSRRETAAVDEVTYRAEVDRLTPEVGPARARAEMADLELSMVVLDTYYRAERTMATEQPACGIEWETLAGLGRIESRHGSYGGGGVSQSGQTIGRIIGIPLDGEEETQEIVDTDGGALDGDVEFDRAVGPMQFIPETWRRFARDGDGNGSADPHNLYDAALTAASYLCRGRSSLGQRANLPGAILSYNNSSSYVSDVLSWRDTYLAPGLPTG